VLTDIRSGRFNPNEPLPAEDTLAGIYDVSRSTIRRVIDNLVSRDELLKEPYRGVWIKQESRQIQPQDEAVAMTNGEIKLPHWSICALIQSDFLPMEHRPINDFVSWYLGGISKAANQCNASVLVNFVPFKDRDHVDSPEFLPPALRNGEDCGIILIHHFPPEAVERLARKYPCVSLQYDYMLPQVDIVCSGMNHAMQTLIKKLFELGHRRIVYAGEITKHFWTVGRLSGYVEAIATQKSNFFEIYDFSETPFEKQMSNLITSIRNGTTAVVCGHDILGYRIMDALMKAGIKIPEEVSMTGFDGMAEPDGLLRLESVIQPVEYLGVAAVKMLQERARQPELPPRQLFYDSRIVEGKTIARVRPK